MATAKIEEEQGTDRRRRIATTLGALATADQALARLAALPVPIKTAYHVAKLARLVTAELKFFQARRLEVFRELGDEVPGPTPGAPPDLRVPPERMAAFGARIDEICAVPVEIAWGPIDLTGLDIRLAAEDLIALGPLVTLAEE